MPRAFLVAFLVAALSVGPGCRSSAPATVQVAPADLTMAQVDAVDRALGLSLGATRGERQALLATGEVGEGADGLLHARRRGRDSSTPDAGIDAVNRRRRTLYSRLADEQGLPPDRVAALAATWLRLDAPTGARLQTPEGAWITK